MKLASQLLNFAQQGEIKTCETMAPGCLITSPGEYSSRSSPRRGERDWLRRSTRRRLHAPHWRTREHQH
jgi:hypothetical protein